MAIHEKSLIDADRLLTHDSLVIDGVDVSGHWNTMITPRTLRDYDDGFEAKIQQYAGAENVHRCWQCGSCTNSCTMYGQNVNFNPRYWIYATRLGLKEEILKDKDIIWQCVSCNKCTNICPKDVKPEGVMKALAHWLEAEGHTQETDSSKFDYEFWDQIEKRGRIEDSAVLKNFFAKTGQDMMQDWFVEMVKRMIKHLPFKHLMHSAMHVVFPPKTQSWGKTGDVLAAYVKEQKESAHG